MPLIIFDNRTCSYDSFETEASTSTYLTNAAEWIIKYMVMGRGFGPTHSDPPYLAVAKNISTARLSELSISSPLIKNLTTSVLTSVCAPDLLAQGTYGFIRDAIAQYLKAQRANSIPSPAFVKVIILTTDVHMFQLANIEVVREVQLLHELVESASQKDIAIYLMCTLVTEVSSVEANIKYRDKALHRASSAFERLGHNFTFSIFANTPINFSAELTNWYSSTIIPITCTILLPSTASMKASLEVEIKGIDSRSHEWIKSFPDMRLLTVQSRVPRSGIDPLHLKGINLIVASPVRNKNNSNEQRIQGNNSLFSALHSALAASDSIFIVSGFAEKTGCINTFALVPRSAGEKSVSSHMALLLLADRDSTLFQYPYVEEQVLTESSTLDLRDYLSECLSEASVDSFYNPKTHPNNLLDFHVRKLDRFNSHFAALTCE